jgi:hypothetical protein
MGIYHFMGLGESIGAVTSAFSYMADCKQSGGDAFRRMFGLSGEVGHPDEHRGHAQALVLFTTDEIRKGIRKCNRYFDNHSRQMSTREQPSQSIPRVLRGILQKELKPLARQRDGRLLPIELYWCDIPLDQPILAFERVAQVLAAAKPPGKQGHEIWINLTGGNNILNAAMQLAASLLGTPARLFYLLAKEPRCIRHTVSPLDPESDRFWIDLPIVYLNYDPLHQFIMHWLTLDVSVSFTTTKLFRDLSTDVEGSKLLQAKGIGTSKDEETKFRFLAIQPLLAQEILVRRDDDGLIPGPGWTRFERYIKALPTTGEDVPHLGKLANQVDWLKKDSDIEVA